MPSRRKAEDLAEVPDDMPNSINPYQVLSVETEATEDQIKKAYRKAALKHHPDKASGDAKATAHTAFQQIAFAYAILSDKKRRARYDATGRCDEAVNLEDDDFDWISFFRAQYADVVTIEKVSAFKESYKGSEEEREHIIQAYIQGKGDMDKVYENVMLSNPLDDEERFRHVLDAAIERHEVRAFAKYTDETDKSKAKRRNKAKKEAKEAEAAVKEAEQKKSKTNAKANAKDTAGSLDNLAAMIQKRHAGGSRFLEHLEEKYTQEPVKRIKKGKRRSGEMDEAPPSEEAFLATRAKMEAGRAPKAKKSK